MATNTAGSVARLYQSQLVHYMRKEVDYNTAGVGSSDTVLVGTLPSGAEIVDCWVNVKTAFNAGSTNVLTAGTSSGSNADIVAAGDVDETATGVTQVTRGWGLAITADTKIYAKFTETGTAATAGKARIMIAYIPDNDG